MNLAHDMLEQQEDLKRRKQREQLRRQGRDFIKVRYVGYTVPHYDPEGYAINLRIHDVHDALIDDVIDSDTGQRVPKVRLGSGILAFRSDPYTGDTIAEVLDDDYNRQFLANHHDSIEIYDEKIAAEVAELIGKDYEVAAVSRREELLRQKKAIEQELQTAEPEKEPAVEATKKVVKRRARRRATRKTNGINKSTPNVDRTRVSRVDEGGAEGDSGSAERSPQDAAAA